MKFYKEISLFPFFEIFNFPFSLEKDKRRKKNRYSSLS